MTCIKCMVFNPFDPPCMRQSQRLIGLTPPRELAILSPALVTASGVGILVVMIIVLITQLLQLPPRGHAPLYQDVSGAADIEPFRRYPDSRIIEYVSGTGELTIHLTAPTTEKGELLASTPVERTLFGRITRVRYAQNNASSAPTAAELFQHFQAAGEGIGAETLYVEKPEPKELTLRYTRGSHEHWLRVTSETVDGTAFFYEVEHLTPPDPESLPESR